MSASTVSARAPRRTWMVGAALALAIVVAAFGAVKPATAAVTVGGNVTCADQSAIVGVWIDARSGGSGWASWGTSGTRYSGWFRRSLPNGGSWRASVGCGGTPSSWASNNPMASFTSSTWVSITCYPGWRYGGVSAYVHDRCF
jgi:hypothetical protein